MKEAQVIAAAGAVLSEAGLHVRMARSTWSSACALLTSELPQYSHRPWEDCKLDGVAETLGVRLGMVWIPQGETILGKIAGQWLRHTSMALARKKKAQTPLSWRQWVSCHSLNANWGNNILACYLINPLSFWSVTSQNHCSGMKLVYFRVFRWKIMCLMFGQIFGDTHQRSACLDLSRNVLTSRFHDRTTNFDLTRLIPKLHFEMARSLSFELLWKNSLGKSFADWRWVLAVCFRPTVEVFVCISLQSQGTKFEAIFVLAFGDCIRESWDLEGSLWKERPKRPTS